MADFSKTRYFTADEFDMPERLNQGLLDMLDDLRGRLGRPVTITSDVRDKSHNAAVGGVDGSQHLTGHAVDIALPADGKYLYDVMKIAFQLGFAGIGVKRQTGRPGMLHLDNRPYDERAGWTYKDT